MTVKIAVTGVEGELDLFNSEAGFLAEVVGLLASEFECTRLPAPDLLARCDRAISEFGLILNEAPLLGRPTSNVADDHLMGLRFLAANTKDGFVNFS